MRFGDSIRDVDFSGMHRGTVVNRVDPMGEGRLGIFLPAFYTEAPAYTESPAPGLTVLPTDLFDNQSDLNLAQKVNTENYIWARPASWLVENGRSASNQGGGYRIPQVGTVVCVYFEGRDANRPYWIPFSPTVKGDVIAAREAGKGTNVENAAANWSDPAKKVNVDVIREYNNGNVLYMDSNADNNAFVLRFSNGHTLTVHHAAESGIILQTQKGHLVQLDENSQEIRVKTHSGNVSVVLKDDGTIVINNTSTTVLHSKGEITVKSDAHVLIQAPTVDINP
jgi:hypothetical protein